MTQPVMRQDPLTGQWVIFSTSRGDRPIRLSKPITLPIVEPADDPFAPGNEHETPGESYAIRRDGSLPNRPGWDLRIVPNRYPAVSTMASDDLQQESAAYGYHEVIIETPRSESMFSRLSVMEIADVFVSVQQRMIAMKSDSRLRSLAYFKNEGVAAGASLPHVHSQLMGLEFVPPFLQAEFDATLRYWRAEGALKGRNWFESLLDTELSDQKDSRIVDRSVDLVSLCPYASRYAYETWFVPTRRNASYLNATIEEIEELARQVHGVLNSLMSIVPGVPYNLALHTAPLGLEEVPHYHWHLELYSRVNGLAGLECGFGSHLNTVMPEQAASALRVGSAVRTVNRVDSTNTR